MPGGANEITRAIYSQTDDVARYAARQAGILPAQAAEAKMSAGGGRRAPLTADSLDGLDAVMQGTDTLLSSHAVNMVPFLLPMGLGAGAMAMDWANKHTGVTAFSKVGAGMTAVKDAKLDVLGVIPGAKTVGGVLEKGINGVSSLGARGLEALGITNLMANHHLKSAVTRHNQMMAAAESVFTQIPHVQHAGLRDALGGLHAQFSHGGPLDMVKVGEVLGETTKLADQVGHSGVSTALGELRKRFDHFDYSVSHAKTWKNLPEAARNVKMGQANLWHGAMNVAFIGGAGIMGYNDVRGAYKAVSTLKQIYANLTGEKAEDVSAVSLFLGKVPEPVAAARAEIVKEYGAAAIFNLLNVGQNIKFAVNHKSGSWLNMAVDMGLLIAAPLGNAVISHGMLGGQLRPAYEQMNEMACKGEKITPDLYAKLLGSASKTLHDRGGADSNFTKGLSEFYARHQASADAVLKEIADGTLMKRIGHLQKEYAAHPEMHPGPVAQKQGHTQAAHPAQGQGASQVERLNGGKSARPVVGPATEKLARENAAHAVQGPQPAPLPPR